MMFTFVIVFEGYGSVLQCLSEGLVSLSLLTVVTPPNQSLDVLGKQCDRQWQINK